MDEPTTSLTARETERLFDIIGAFKEQGLAIVYISHRMEEIYRLSDRVSVLRDSAWYYVQSRVESFTYHPPRVIDRAVLAINFDQRGVVRDIHRYGLEDGRVIDLETRTTDTGGRRMGVLEQLFGNILNLDAEAVNEGT